MNREMDDVLMLYAFKNETLASFDTGTLLRCLHVETSEWKKELGDYYTGKQWSAQKRRKTAENFRDQILNELLRREQDAIQGASTAE